MTFKRMIDCTHANLPAARPHILPGDIVALYDTGTPGIRATAGDKAFFPGHPLVGIDQGFTGSPHPTSTVRDVEANAWSLSLAVKTDTWVAERKTIYCTRGNLTPLVSLGWQGDVWVANPTGIEPMIPFTHPGLHIVAEQWNWLPQWDVSSVFDTTWPHANVPASAPGLSVTPYMGFIDAGWSAVHNANNYEIEIIHIPSRLVKAALQVPVTHLAGYHLPAGRYGVKVRARNPAGYGPWSVEREITVT